MEKEKTYNLKLTQGQIRIVQYMLSLESIDEWITEEDRKMIREVQAQIREKTI